MKKALTKEIIIKSIEQNKDKIRSFGVEKLTLFGSYARDEATSKSDIDFLVEFRKERGGFDDYVKLLHFLEDLFKLKIDLGEKKLLKENIKESVLETKRIEVVI